MADFTNPQHPLVRDGRSQTERLDLGALAPESVALDDRSERQLLVYLNEFAKSVAFYETDGSAQKNLQQSNWQPFFRSSSSVQVSLIETFDTPGYENRYASVKQGFTEGLSRASYAPWFDFLFESALTVNSWFVALSNDVVLLENEVVLNESPLRRIIQDLIRSNLQPALAQLFGVANLFARPTPPSVGYQLPDMGALAEFWGLDTIQFQRDSKLANLSQQDVERDFLINDRLDDIFRTFAKTIRQIVAEAAGQDILQPTQTHEPHLALLYTFLRLLRPVLNDFNGLPQKHLDFYYRDVLKLQPKPLVPDAIHALFELPKPVLQYRLPKSTQLKDGKDANKVDVLFALDDEVIVNQTQIAELRTLFRNEKKFLAKPKANSIDGLGKDFPDSTETKWATLGNAEGGTTAIARVGFAIASQTLVLSSGVRTITLTLISENQFPAEAANAFDVNLSGAKKWIAKTAQTTISPDGTQLILTVALGIKDDAIVAADPAVLGVDYGLTTEAVLQLIVNDQAGIYEALRSIKIKSVKLVTAVSQLQNVQVRTDEGDQDPTKPFMPFGAVPSIGSSFAIGSPEIFAKELTSFTVKFEWDKLPADFNKYYEGYALANPPAIPPNKDYFGRRIFFYRNGIPFNEETNPGNVFDPLTLSSTNFQNKPFTSAELLSLPTVPALKDTAWQDGLVLVQLQKDFLHPYYTEALTRNALRLANPPIDASLVGITVQQIDVVEGNITGLAVNPLNPPPDDAQQKAQADDLKLRANVEVDTLKSLPVRKLTINPPYTPVIKNLTVGYTAETTIDDLSQSDAKLFHIMPFDGGTNYRAIQLNDTLLYNFEDKKVAGKGTPQADTGALLIGLSNAIEGSLLPILFQLLESSAKTNLDPAIIKWNYLDGNEWQVLTAGKHLLNDATNGFIQSGIVQIVLPERTSSQKTTILPPSFYWLKAATEGDTDAVCQAVGVHAQAARATFTPASADDPTKQNDPARLALPLAAGSVTKLGSPDVTIKAVKQPYPSFGGWPAESASHFYSRVSEQLRHKGRGVTLFDYEQLVLEAFPELFKVKCIPHTFANRRIGSTNETINDVHAAPGHVTLVVVPDATKTQIDDLEKPMASRGLLTRIHNWIKSRISPFVKIQVLNPIYQEVDTAFSVQFYPGKSPEFYREQLLKDIDRFLAPWTFDPTAQVTFGGVIYRSSILGFIENREYVSFVTDFVMKLNDVSQEEIQASAARVIFTNGTHEIKIFTPDSVRKSVDRGIGFDWRLTA